MYRIAQEAYATRCGTRGAEVTVALRLGDGATGSAAVGDRDDGVGFDATRPCASRTDGHFGLPTCMRRRRPARRRPARPSSARPGAGTAFRLDVAAARARDPRPARRRPPAGPGRPVALLDAAPTSRSWVRPPTAEQALEAAARHEPGRRADGPVDAGPRRVARHPAAPRRAARASGSSRSPRSPTAQRVADMLAAGAVGYLLKDCDPDDLLAAVRAAARGDAPLDPRVAGALLPGRRAPDAGRRAQRARARGAARSRRRAWRTSRSPGLSDQRAHRQGAPGQRVPPHRRHRPHVGRAVGERPPVTSQRTTGYRDSPAHGGGSGIQGGKARGSYARAVINEGRDAPGGRAAARARRAAGSITAENSVPRKILTRQRNLPRRKKCAIDRRRLQPQQCPESSRSWRSRERWPVPRPVKGSRCPRGPHGARRCVTATAG